MVALWALLLNPISKWFSVLSPYGRMSVQPVQPLQGSDLPPRQCRPPVAESFPLNREKEAQLAGCLGGLVPATALEPFLQK